MAEATCAVDSKGTKYWRLNNRLHRTDGPAIEFADGSESWWLNGNLHRNSGPAVTAANGETSWWIYGKKADPLVCFVTG